MTEELELLIVEDKVDEAIYAQLEAAKAGFRNIAVAQNLSGALNYLNNHPKYIASDLFFPAGNLDAKLYSERFAPFYEEYEKTRFPKVDNKNKECMILAVKACAETFGVTPEKYVDEIMPKMNTSEFILKSARNAVHGIEDYARYEKFQKIKEDVKEGRNLPLGIILIEEAAKKEIPSVIVTSTYHHDDEFEPVRELVTTHYFDQLVEGKKDWKSGIEFLKSKQSMR